MLTLWPQRKDTHEGTTYKPKPRDKIRISEGQVLGQSVGITLSTQNKTPHVTPLEKRPWAGAVEKGLVVRVRPGAQDSRHQLWEAPSPWPHTFSGAPRTSNLVPGLSYWNEPELTAPNLGPHQGSRLLDRAEVICRR